MRPDPDLDAANHRAPVPRERVPQRQDRPTLVLRDVRRRAEIEDVRTAGRCVRRQPAVGYPPLVRQPFVEERRADDPDQFLGDSVQADRGRTVLFVPREQTVREDRQQALGGEAVPGREKDEEGKSGGEGKSVSVRGDIGGGGGGKK